ncbi:MAG TPA: hypothetical protein VMD92_19115 [Acidobacteriaceae bacterium]|jgi:hypothetical protein|nr:hypothetical protein [Acidobacteriaceae bacterium]
MKRALPDRLAMLVVRLAGAMVPRAERPEWVAEWAGELWQVQRAGAGGGPAQVDAIGFSLGAVRDAFLIGGRRCADRAQRTFARGSAARCIAFLGALAVAGVLAFLIRPGARRMIEPLPYGEPANLVLVSRYDAIGKEKPSILLSEYREWTTDTAELYSLIAFYAPETTTLRIRHRRPAPLVVAVASRNLLQVLRLHLSGASPRLPIPPSGPVLVLTQAAWARWYRSDPGVLGSVADLRGQQATIAGVLPDGDWRLPVHADAVLLEDARDSEMLPSTLMGFVVARIRPSAFPPARGGRRSMVEARDGEVLHYACTSLGDVHAEPAQAFAFCVVLALLALPVIAVLSVGEYPIAPEALRAKLVIRRCAFVTAKFVLVATAVAAWSSAIACGAGSRDTESVVGHLVLAAFFPLLFGFRWVLQDQRHRCPVCMRKLTHPARVGQASWSFLGWYGTEMMCSRGHGLLHIAELPTSWFGTQRWLGLDPSWLGLFEDRSVRESHSG